MNPACESNTEPPAQCWLELGWLELGWLELGWLELGWLELGWLELAAPSFSIDSSVASSASRLITPWQW
jgi:hypothetical protein